MTLSHVIVIALLVVLVALATLAFATAARKSIRVAMDSRRARIEARVRPRLMKLLASEGQEETDLSGVSGGDGRVLESVTASLLSKLRGEDRAAVVRMLDARGTLRAARRSLRGIGTVRRARAAEFLGATGTSEAYEDLCRLLEGRNAELRNVAARSLGRLGIASPVEPLLRALDGPRSIPTGIVTMALLHIGPPAEDPLREIGLSNESLLARQISAELLGVLGAYAAVPDLMVLARHDTVPAVRHAALSALGRIGHPRAVGTLVACLEDGDSSLLSASAARSLGQVGSTQAVLALADAVRRDDHTVARNAAEALTRLGGAGRAALDDIARSSDDASRYAGGALSAADARTVRSRRAA
jgi:HEAT repeat protein